jgi:asparagine synthetase B (glutamine-hydrolysing)
MGEWAAIVDWDGVTPWEPASIRLVMRSAAQCVKILQTNCGHCEVAAASTHERFVHLARVDEGDRTVFAALDGIAYCRAMSDYEHYSMSEQVARAFLRWGDQCVEHLEGQWSFLVLEPKRRVALAARDAGGTHPLYYRSFRGGWLLGNCARSLATPNSLPACKVDKESVVERLAGVKPRPWSTMFQGVNRLAPGCRLILTGADIAVDAWWQPVPWEDDQELSEPEQLDHYRNALIASVRDSFSNAQSPCISLSGGLDSSTIAVICKDLAASGQIATPCTVSAAYPRHPQCDERARIELLVSKLGFKSRWAEPNVSEDPMLHLWKLDDPRFGLYVANTCAFGRSAAAAGSDVVAFGTLGDVMGGMPSRWPQMTEQIDKPSPNGGFGLAHAAEYVRLMRLQARLLRRCLSKPRYDELRWLQRIGLGSEYSFQMSCRVAGARFFDVPGPLGGRAEHSVALVSADDIEAVGALANIRSEGLEAVSPFLDRRVIESSLRLGTALRRKGNLGRWALRRIAEGRSPDEIRLNSRKVVFNEFFADHRRFLALSRGKDVVGPLSPYADQTKLTKMMEHLAHSHGRWETRAHLLIVTGLWLIGRTSSVRSSNHASR